MARTPESAAVDFAESSLFTGRFSILANILLQQPNLIRRQIQLIVTGVTYKQIILAYASYVQYFHAGVTSNAVAGVYHIIPNPYIPEIANFFPLRFGAALFSFMASQ